MIFYASMPLILSWPCAREVTSQPLLAEIRLTLVAGDN